MKQIGLILEGENGEAFLTQLLAQENDDNAYTLITQTLIFQSDSKNYVIYHFDASSAPKLQETFSAQEPDMIFLIQDVLKECKLIYYTLRQLFPHTLIITTHTLDAKDPLLKEISPSLLTSHKLLSHLPNLPTPVQDIGLGKGEIIQIPVPFGSAYCYRTLGSIHQKGWKITGIYRNDELLLGSYALSIQPNDKLLAIGNPKILDNVYRQITSSLGQFPNPFGKNLCLYLDENLLDENEILQSVDEALFLHKHLKNAELFITLLNPKRFALLDHIKSIAKRDIHFYIGYDEHSLIDIISSHKSTGLAILHPKLFHPIKKHLLKLSIPIFKIGSKSIQEVASSLIFLESDSTIAPIAFDIASQLDLRFEIYDFEVDGNYQLEALETYKNLSQIFDKPLQLTQSNTQNPIIYLLKQERALLQFLPLDSFLVQGSLVRATSTHLAHHSSYLDKNPQIFIPCSYEND